MVFISGGQAWQLDDAIASFVVDGDTHVVVLIGILDVLSPQYCNPPRDCRTAEHLASVCSKIESLGAKPLVATMLPLNPRGAFSHVSLEGLNDEIRGLGYTVVDFSALGVTSQDFYDNIHPLPALQARMAAVVDSTVR